jgi:putative permease
MIKLITQWYQRKFSDPHAVTLLIVLLCAFLFVYFFNQLLMPVFVALAIAFLLDLPVSKLIALGWKRTSAVVTVVGLFISISLAAMLGLFPIIWQQSSRLLSEVPSMISLGQSYLSTLPEQYPEFITAEQINTFIKLASENVLDWGQVVIKASLTSLSNLVALMIYLILVPLMVFFFLKDKAVLFTYAMNFLPSERRMTIKVGKEMHQQIFNYIRGKLIEILAVGISTTLAFVLLDLEYAVLLGVLVGLSVLVPYVGATIVTIPVILVALFQYGYSSEFGYIMLAYAVIQGLDGNLLVPLLFSEAVNLHPVTIIIAVIFFGGLWGFWGIFFAIPLATLVKAVMNAWPTQQIEVKID